MKRLAAIFALCLFVFGSLSAGGITGRMLAVVAKKNTGGGGGGVETSYANTGGTGDRTAIITATSAVVNFGTGNATKLINGTSVFDCWWHGSLTGAYVQFDFGSGKVINEAKWYQSALDSNGVWQWEGSNDASSWTAIGSSFTLGTSATQTITELSGNTTSYRYYRLNGVSGSASSGAWLYEMEFKISP